MTDPYKRSGNGQFAKVASENLDKAKANAAILTSKAADTEATRQIVVSSFTKAATTALASGEGGGSAITGAKASRGSILYSLGSLVGKKTAGKKGEAIGKIIASTLSGGLTSGIPGAIAGAVATSVALDAESKKIIGADVDKALGLSQSKPKNNKADKANVASPVLAEIDRNISTLKKEVGDQSNQVSNAIGKELDKRGLSEAADIAGRTTASAATQGAVSAALTKGGPGLLYGAASALPAAAMTLGVAGLGALGEKIGGKDGGVIGRALGGTIVGGMTAAVTTGGLGILPMMAIGGATGLAMSNPNDIVHTGKSLGKVKDSFGKSLAHAAKQLAKEQKA